MRIAIIGGGAAGLMAACTLCDLGEQPVLFERNDRVGRKRGITGQGRCNLTNRSDVQTVLENIPTNKRFLYGALSRFTPFDVMAYFEDTLGLPLKTERGNRVFPQSDKAHDVVSALENHLKEGGCRTVFRKVTGIKREEDGSFLVVAEGKAEHFERVILSTGGCSYPATGSDGSGYRLAQSLGHSIVPPVPSLVPLECFGGLCRALQGLSLKNTGLTVYDTVAKKKVYEDFGEMLFAHFGLTGPMILSASAHMRQMAPGRYEVHLDLKPALNAEMLDKRLQNDFVKYSNKDFSNSLQDLLPSKMIAPIVSLSGIDPHKKVNELRKEERRELVRLLKDLKLTVKNFRPIAEAIVTSGGVKVEEVDGRSMESKLVKGLYFAGEMLDVDAYTGGFNLQIAFSTGRLAALSAGRA